MKDALVATLIEEYSTVEAFASILTLETKALTAISPLEQLPAIVEKKTELIGVLARLEAARDSHLAELGFPTGWSGMELAASTDARVATQWKLLQKAADRARRVNTNNGELIRVRMDYNERALKALQVNVPRKTNLYGPDGRVPAYSGL
ncbi:MULTISPECIES: flagella synthesis protein FlgN [Paraburkholderia]|uniref:Flagella synthesis protein FlgN n=1 Tax=Paraburkholderia tuberum TaxID=157910 RepID=A0A1H1DDT1_9BURK|nr:MULTISPECIES: flagellar protein FlgN [Paraburkholderia]MBC8727087.1 flagellar protein FlgN [Paraburkholderia sp. UCT2]SDQ74378.1 flagella synthesis protein FlgN [Paraburkholderia tuberum]